MSLTPLHVIIIGGGIGGLCLAQKLKATGISVAVYERNSSDVWQEGYHIHINPFGSQALYESLPTALWEAFLATARKTSLDTEFLTEQLQKLMVLNRAKAHGTGNPVRAHYPISRIALRSLLLAGLEDVVHFDKAFERYESTHDGKVTAYFADGTSATGDVLVGADGANSRVCKQYLPQAARVEIGVVGVFGKLLLTEQTRAWLPSQLLLRTNLIMPRDRYFMVNNPFDRGPASDEALNRIYEKAKAAGLNPDLLIDNTPDSLLWGFFAPINGYSLDMRSLDGHGLQRVIGQMIERWHPDVRRLVAEADPSSISLNSLHAWSSCILTLYLMTPYEVNYIIC